MEAKSSPFIEANYQATDAMIASMSKDHALPADAKILVATVVELDTLNESSTLGRSISEQVQARLTQRGYAVIEAKLRGQMVMNKAQGELMLSRELRDLQKSHSAEAVVVGTYTLARNYVYVNLKMIGPDNIALGAHNYALPLDRNVRALLNKQP
jgi:TolB-like protein